jgi:hypothetical protein
MTYVDADALADALASMSIGQGAALVSVEGGGTVQEEIDVLSDHSFSTLLLIPVSSLAYRVEGPRATV